MQFSEYRLTSSQWYSLMLAYKDAERGVQGFQQAVSTFIDPQELHENILASRAFKSIANMEGKVVPIFVFDVDFDVPLQGAPAVAFPEFVVLVNADYRGYFSKFMCQETQLSEGYSNNVLDSTRFVLGAVMETAWGVAPSYQTWSSIRNEISEDYTFAAGFTPFGPFSTSLKLSFALKDASMRALLLHHKNQTATLLRDYLTRFQALGSEVREIFPQDTLETLHYRWENFMMKYSAGVSATSHHSFPLALFLFRSLWFSDLEKVTAIFTKSSLLLITDVQCPESVQASLSTSLVVGLVELGLLLTFVFNLTVLLKRFSRRPTKTK